MINTKTILLALFFSCNAFAQCYNAVEIIPGSTIGLHTDGTLWSWGYNNQGVLGTGVANNSSYPNTQIGSENNWTTKFNLSNHVLAIKTDGSLWAWGKNTNGECGNGTSGDQNFINIPQHIGTGTWLEVATGTYYSLGIKTDGTLWTWGQIVNTNILVPTQIGTDSDWTKVFSDARTSFAIKANGTLWSWGLDYGNIGRVTTTVPANIPGQVGTANNWVSIDATDISVLGLKADGTLWAWGHNYEPPSYFPYFGNGVPETDTNNYYNNPTQIGTATDWHSITSSQQDFYVIKNNGTLWAWGRNAYGELGDGTTVAKYVPTQIGADANWLNISTDGSLSVIGLKTNNTLYSWGHYSLPFTTTPSLVGTVCSLGIATYDKNKVIKAFPNPTKDWVTLSFDSSITPITGISVTNALGQVVTVLKKESVANGKEIDLNLSNCAYGLYFIKINTQSDSYTVKVNKN
jgi:Secretion system C-terminal sorting domain/Regulator of chromosome condensation (RCC1) repeat